MVSMELGADSVGFFEQRLQDVARSIGVGKELSIRFRMEADADLREERDRVRDWKPAENAANDGSFAAPEVAFRHGDVRDVAARAAADQDFCARLFCPIEEDDGPRWIGVAGKDG